jgi:eight-cysteine-cluster-containing protein
MGGIIIKNKKYLILVVGLIIMVTVLFFLKLQTSKKPSNQCIVSGCNGEICQNKNDEPMASICLWSEKFTCYKTAKCEIQKDGSCGWTMDKDLSSCLSKTF